eukprot:TRINITY_DN22529_c0_g1_i1.p1 TRINITY_DN22529_c0_g1~~TRINITY_DN22529_c0_g1_i1.p1  ORF type:complete len:336 (+),score=68.03 TRINITY_DN22529_c0_g1_i1:27-1034(+)
MSQTLPGMTVRTSCCRWHAPWADSLLQLQRRRLLSGLRCVGLAVCCTLLWPELRRLAGQRQTLSGQQSTAWVQVRPGREASWRREQETASPAAWPLTGSATKRQDRREARKLLTSRAATRQRKRKEDYSPFTEKFTSHRGTTGRGKQGHFHLLDKYIKRIDAMLPEDMEDLVKPLGYKPNQEQTTRTIKITFTDEFGEFIDPGTVQEEDVRRFLSPLEPEFVTLGWNGTEGNSEVYVKFEDNEQCQKARKLDGGSLGSNCAKAKVRFTVDNKFRRVMEDLGLWEKTKKEEPEEPVSDESEDDREVISSWVAPPKPERRTDYGHDRDSVGTDVTFD